MNWVLDASMTLAWLLPRTDAAEAELADRALTELPSITPLVPAIWHAEIANAMLRSERSGLIQAAQTAFFLERLSRAAIETDEKPPRAYLASVLALARTHGLTAYDATYLELAMRRAAVLATFDRKLATAARTAAVRVFGDSA